MTRLWEADHPYYCNEGNYYYSPRNDGSPPFQEYGSWREFARAEADSDPDMNLVFRFDWCGPEDADGGPIPPKDDYYRDSILKIFFMGQRKGLYRWVTVQVCRADEPEVRAWLTQRWLHMCRLWEPISTAARPAEGGTESGR